MGKNQSASNITNIIKQDANGGITFMSGSTMLMAIGSSGAITTTGTISGSDAANAVSSSYALISTTATTASYADNLLVKGSITAQTLVVQTITSSVSLITGSTQWGSIVSNTHVFTGSLLVSGSNIILTNNALGIGRTPSSALDVNGSARVSGGFTLGSGYAINFYDANTSVYTWIEGSSYNQSFSYLGFTTGGSEKVRITSGGNVGIGTTSPSSPLHVIRYAGSSGTVLLEGNDNVVGLPGVTFKNNNGGATSYVSMTAGGGVNINGTLYATGSNIGIGTTNPGYKLDVAGTGKFNSNVIVNSAGAYSNGTSALNIESNSWAIVDANVKRQMQRVIGYVGDYEQHVILLHPIYNSTLIEFNKCAGTLYATRGWTYAGLINDTYEIDTSSAYAGTTGTLKSNYNVGKLYTCLYNGIKYMAIIPGYRTSAVMYHFDGYIANNTGGETLKLVTYRNSSTGTVINSEINNSLTAFNENDNFINGLLYPRQGIRFASGATTLNYYEEGDFSPTYYGSSGGLIVSSTAWAKYIRIGSFVHVDISVNVNATSTGTQYFVFGLPFNFSSTTGYSATGIVSNYNLGANSSAAANVGVSLRNSSGNLYQQYVQATFTSTGTTQMNLSISYKTF